MITDKQRAEFNAEWLRLGEVGRFGVRWKVVRFFLALSLLAGMVGYLLGGGS